MKYVILIAALFCTLAAQAAPDSGLAKVKKLAASEARGDVKIVAQKIAEGLCGAEGPSYVADLQVKHLDRRLNEQTGEVELVDRWETVKTYGIPAQELKESRHPALMDMEACME